MAIAAAVSMKVIAILANAWIPSEAGPGRAYSVLRPCYQRDVPALNAGTNIYCIFSQIMPRKEFHQ